MKWFISDLVSNKLDVYSSVIICILMNCYCLLNASSIDCGTELNSNHGQFFFATAKLLATSSGPKFAA